jgi:hypothetical protein
MKRYTILLCLLPLTVSAQEGTVLTATPDRGPAPLTVTLNWSSTGESCEASGGWTGMKPPSGEEQVVVTSSTVFHIICRSAENVTNLSWVLPTEREDGSPVENLESTLVFHSLNAIDEENFIVVPVPETSYVFQNLPEGNWVFAAKAKDGYGLISQLSSIATKRIVAVEETSEILVTIVLPPKPPSLVTVDSLVYEIRRHSVHGMQIWRPIGEIDLGVECNPDLSIGEYHEVPMSAVKNLKRLPTIPIVVALCRIG